MIPFADNKLAFIEYHYPQIWKLLLCDDVKPLIASYLLSDDTIANKFADNGYANCMGFICNMCSPKIIKPRAIQSASLNGHVKIVRMLIEANKPCSEFAIRGASARGHVEIVRMLIEANAPCDEYAIWHASVNGHVEIVRMLIEANAPCDEYAVKLASKNGHVEIVRLLENYIHS